MKALIIDQVSEHIKEFLESKGADVDVVFLPTYEELSEIIGAYDLLVMRVDPKIDSVLLDKAVNLKAITVSAVGTNHIDLAYAKEKGIQVFNSPGMNSNTVAELTVSKMLDLARNVIPANNTIKEKHIWNKYVWTGVELYGRVLGLVGFGKIGRRVAKLVSGFDMTVLAYDPYLSEEEISANGGCKVTMEELLKNSDVISLHVPLTDETRGIISDAEFEQMKQGVIVLNMSRGHVLDEKAAYTYMKSGKVRGIGVDVMAGELDRPIIKGETTVESPLFEFDNFIVSPHIGGGGTIDGLDILGECVIARIKEVFGY